MCGITGLISLSSEAVPNLSKIAQSNQKLFSRGPDNGNVFTEEKIALGHRRLSIIDPSLVSSQPMLDNSGRYVIVFNGEIFNYQDLSAQYLSEVWQRNGGPKTTSDTEVLLYL